LVKDTSIDKTGGHSLKRLLIWIPVALAAAILLAACGGGGGTADGPSPGPTTGNATVSAKQIGDVGTVLVDRDGKALYASEEETGGTVLCTGACTSFWEPLTVSGATKDSSLPGSLGAVKRPDGTSQVTYDGRLLYSFSLDQPGEVTGDGFADAFGGQQFTWHVVLSDGSTGSSDMQEPPSSGSYGY
jgi:predicted lipoprotein with Yx(FWY)xxD motif